jgi:hypothetical protein
MINNFPYEQYLKDYADLRQLSRKEAYEHYLNCGIFEGRILDNFSYSDYIESNNDLKDFGKKEAYLHFLNHGIHEGRISKVTCVNTETNIVIIIHLYNLNMLDEFLEYVENVKKIFQKVTVIFTISGDDKNIIKNKNQNFIVLQVENKGVDIYPFLLSIKYIRENNISCDFILKLHTKMSINTTEELNNWRKELIEPITNKYNLLSIQHYMKNIENLGFIASQKCLLPKKFDLDFPQNIDGINNVLKEFPNLPQDWASFNAGNMFWINNKILDLYLDDNLINYISSRCVFGKPPCNLTSKEIHIEYIAERLITGVLCYESVNVLVNEYKGTQRGYGATDGKIDNTYFNQYRVFSFHKPNNPFYI